MAATSRALLPECPIFIYARSPYKLQAPGGSKMLDGRQIEETLSATDW